ncbi:MAG: hypothetical protein M1816_001317 [Peltula sp. TS41687]|nr:MAG: hypothetical protein M1816_001317 [Peltula sp. TS41687]
MRDQYLFEMLELSPTSKAVIETKGRLRRCFPGLAVMVSGDRIADSSFRQPLAELLMRLDANMPKEVQRIATKAGSSSKSGIRRIQACHRDACRILRAIGSPLEVWVIEQTEEVFTDYESYLRRMDYYKQVWALTKRFVCELTGHSNLDFFSALRSERRESEGVDQKFPEPLKEPVLRRVQFSTVSRIDVLVDNIYDEFKQAYYPGEHVTVTPHGGERLSGTVREKTRFPEIRRPDGSLERASFSRYFVMLSHRPDLEALVDDQHIMRDRKSFTKLVLRSFIKDNATRESWNGAPWLVKEHVAQKFRISGEVPAHLQRGGKFTTKKALLAQQKNRNHDGSSLQMVLNPSQLPELRPAPKNQKGLKAKQKLQQFVEYQQTLPPHEIGRYLNCQPNGQAHFIYADFPPIAPATQKLPPKPSPPPPIKYPIEDLEIPPLRDGTHRPPMKYLSQDTPAGVKNLAGRYGIMMKTVGSLLETWNTLNVFCQVLLLDSFTFDDYLEALHFSSESVHCELYVEIYCALLKIFVDSEASGGKVQVELPKIPEDEDEKESGSEAEDDTGVSHTPETVNKGQGRSLRSRETKHVRFETGRASSKASTGSARNKVHRAKEMMAGYGWVDRLRQRDFSQGGWEIIIVGLFDQISRKPQHHAACENILAKLAPLHLDPTRETARLQYASLDINTRAKVLQILCLLAVDLKAIRGELEHSNELMTEVRKEKVEWQRARKVALEELRALDEERKLLLPENSAPLPEAAVNGNGNTKVAEDREDTEEIDEGNTSMASEPNSKTGRLLRARKVQQSGERKRKRGQDDGEKAPAKPPKLSNKFKKVLVDIEKKKATIQEHEKEIAKADEDMREIECSRTKCLGKDRFWNRYWFLERNAMPWKGLPGSSTADAEYANGCLWVQGPDDMEREGFIELTGEEERGYRKRFQMDVVERKKLEEGSTTLSNAHQWGYFDEPESLDMLIGWLDVRGDREVKLRKELQSFRGKIMEHMEKRKEYLETDGKKNMADEPMKRVSTRTKTPDGETQYRCQRWRNKMVLNELGHLHSEEPKARKSAKRTGNTRDTKKPLGRQGTRYNF